MSTTTHDQHTSDECFPDWSWIPDSSIKNDILKVAGFGEICWNMHLPGVYGGNFRIVSIFSGFWSIIEFHHWHTNTGTQSLPTVFAQHTILKCEGVPSITVEVEVHKPRANTNWRLFFFSHWVVSWWNSIPDEVVTPPNIDTFKVRLDLHLKHHPVLFNYRALDHQQWPDITVNWINSWCRQQSLQHSEVAPLTRRSGSTGNCTQPKFSTLLYSIGQDKNVWYPWFIAVAHPLGPVTADRLG